MMKTAMFGLILIYLTLVLNSESIGALKILGLFPLPGRSHFIPNGHLMKSLANRGHQVHVVSHFPLKKPIPNYTDISLAGISPMATNNMTYNDTTSFNQFSMQNFVYKTGIETCNFLSEDVLQKLLKTPKNTYDVIVVELFNFNCYIAFGKHLNAPIVGTVASKMHDWLYGPFGIPMNTAYMPSLMSSSTQLMTFTERLFNTFMVNFITSQINYYVEDEREHVEKYFGRKLSSMSELYDDIALVLVNSHHSLNGIIPLPTGVIEVGGLHVHDDEQTLSPDIKKWLDESKDGCVYFTLGSMVRIETFPPKVLESLYGMFRNIAPVRVLMKIVDPSMLPSGLPKNVMTSFWLPQVAVLKHPNTKLFITHGGLIGTQEAVAHGIPMVGLPVFGDQFTNLRTYENKGVAITLNHQEITGESLTKAVKTVLNDPSYSKNMKAVTKLFNDRPMSAMDTAIYWIEYVARHGNVLKSPATRLTWWQYYLLDVYGLILFVILLIFFIAKRLLKFLFRLICSKKSTPGKTNISKSKKVS